MEIERKWKIETLPDGYDACPFHVIEQAYLCTDPVVRIRRQDEEYYLTYKSKGLLQRAEYNLPLTQKAYEHLLTKADGIVLTKKRYLLPLQKTAEGSKLTIELDVFSGIYEGLILAEVEFPTKEEALAFTAPDWFGRDVTFTGEYQNSRLSQHFSAPLSIDQP